MSKYNAAYQAAWREANRDRITAKRVADRPEPKVRETQLPESIYAAGRELREMMNMPARDWPASKYATGANANGNDA